MSGGNREYVMGNYGENTGNSPSNIIAFPGGKYIDIYPSDIFTNNDRYKNYDQCTWSLCGGHSLYETLIDKSSSRVNLYEISWGQDESQFAYSENPWVTRGGYHYTRITGIFATSNTAGGGGVGLTSRPILVVLPRQ